MSVDARFPTAASSGGRPPSGVRRGTGLLVLGVVLVTQAALVATLGRSVRAAALHDVPVSVVAPAVVAQALAQEVEALDERPFRVTATDDRADAVRDVRHGVVVAALLVDLRGTRDVLMVDPARDQRLTRAVVAQVRALEAARDRTAVVRRVAAERAVSSSEVTRLALVGSVIGFAGAVLVALALGPLAPTLGLGAVRLAWVAVAAVLAGLLLAAGSGVVEGRGAVAVVVGAGVLAAALATLALAALYGLRGLGMAAVLFLALDTPLVLDTDPLLMPEPWRTLGGWTPAGAARQAVGALVLFEGTGLTRALAVLAGWCVAGVVALAAARGARPATASPVLLQPMLRPWRLRVLAAVVPVAVALLVLAGLLPRDDVAATVPVAVRSVDTACVATGDVHTVADLNRIATRVRGRPEFLGADVGADVLLQDGRRLMMFGDTLRGDGTDDDAGSRFIRNSMLVFAPDCVRVVMPESGGAVIPDRGSGADAVGYWPMSVGAVAEPGYDLVAVAAQRVRSTGEGTFSFEALGPAAALFVVPRGRTPQLLSVQDLGEDSTDRTRPMWGAASAVVGDWVYLYGTANPGADYVFGFSLRVARVRVDDLLDESAWRFWDGEEWVRDSASATELIGADGGVSQTLSVFEQGAGGMR